jgi:gliding motility-associated-like protein
MIIMKSTAQFTVRSVKESIKTLLLAFVLVFMAGQSGALMVYPRIFTPNGDGRNDKVLFEVDNPAALPIRGEVFDVRGAKVGDLQNGPKTDSLLWDGRDGMASVPSGVYIYQIEVGGRLFSGTVVVVE